MKTIILLKWRMSLRTSGSRLEAYDRAAAFRRPLLVGASRNNDSQAPPDVTLFSNSVLQRLLDGQDDLTADFRAVPAMVGVNQQGLVAVNDRVDADDGHVRTVKRRMEKRKLALENDVRELQEMLASRNLIDQPAPYAAVAGADAGVAVAAPALLPVTAIAPPQQQDKEDDDDDGELEAPLY